MLRPFEVRLSARVLFGPGTVSRLGQVTRDRGACRALLGSIGCGVWCASTYDGFSFGRFVNAYPHLRGTVTDLLIGDLFEDKVDKVWPPMESMYPPGKGELPSWSAGTPADAAEHKANELVLPEGRKP